jgi:hypothetical protein
VLSLWAEEVEAIGPGAHDIAAGTEMALLMMAMVRAGELPVSGPGGAVGGGPSM